MNGHAWFFFRTETTFERRKRGVKAFLEENSWQEVVEGFKKKRGRLLRKKKRGKGMGERQKGFYLGSG